MLQICRSLKNNLLDGSVPSEIWAGVNPNRNGSLVLYDSFWEYIYIFSSCSKF